MRTVGMKGRRPAGPLAAVVWRWARLVARLWRVPYSAGTARRFGYALASVPVAAGGLLLALAGQGRVAARWQAALVDRLLGGAPRPQRQRRVTAPPVARRGAAYALLSAPVGLAAYAVTAELGWLVLINLAYPLRPYLGFKAPAGGDVWSHDYAGIWGGPTLAGVWGLHAGVVLLTVVPLLGWVIRGLTRIQAVLAARLLDVRVAAPAARSERSARLIPATPAVAPVPATPPALGSAAIAPERVPVPLPAARAAGGRRGRVAIRALVGLALVTLFVVLSRTAHALGIGDNILWLPRDARSGAALAVTLAPLALLPAAVSGRVPVPRRR